MESAPTGEAPVLRVAVLVTVHNRVSTTVAGLQRLASLSEQLSAEVSFSVFLVDDGSSDGTTARVREIPMDLTVVQGSGQLYWNRGMVLAYQTALASGRELDAYLLYNDDVLLNDRFIDFIRQYAELDGAILVGAVCDPDTGATTYSGVQRIHRRTRLEFIYAEPTTALTPVDTFNGNCVLIPRDVFDALGGLDPVFTHFMGDFDLGLRAQAQGVQSLLFTGWVGTCPIGISHRQRIHQSRFGERWALLFRFPHRPGLEMYFVRKHSAPRRLPVYELSVLKRRLDSQFRVGMRLGRVKRVCRRVIDSFS